MCFLPALWGLALCADFVIVNTVVSGRVLRALSDTGVPVLWWLHDAFAGYPHIAHQIPKTIAPNVEVYSVGKHAAAAMHAVRPEFEIKQLIYGLPDYSKEDFPVYDLGYANGRPLFVTVGSFERRKGQDIFCKAIRLLPPEVRQKASFLFVGKAADREMMDAVRNLTADYPSNVFYCKRLSRDEIKSLMQQCTCLVCASRDDPMPTFVTEGLIFGKPSIVSEHTGTAGLVTEGVDGFVYRDDDPAQLEKLLCWAIEHPAELAAMRQRLPRPLRALLFQRSVRPDADHGGKRADRKSGTVEQQITLEGQADACPFYHIAVFAKKNLSHVHKKPAGICYTVLKSR
ncbi:MAG: glycosyltransferase family 4 protein [Hominenteromicrobium sp.]|uniref:glycosyltransferase family 4 protein n=1 Tax=Hominenteromicrobium sp. TaxID=3073581 RepID=UPI0039A230B1